MYAESDRRRKTDINPINITLDHYDKLNPVSYRYKEEESFKLGLIAQDAMQVSKELVSIFPNENMVIEDPDVDLEGFQYTLDYGSLSALNAAAIKLLITEITNLKADLDELRSIISEYNIQGDEDRAMAAESIEGQEVSSMDTP